MPLGAAPGKTRLVLLVHSYDTSMEWTQDITEGLFDGLRDTGVDVDLREEFLDTRRNSRPEYLARVRDVLARHGVVVDSPAAMPRGRPSQRSYQKAQAKAQAKGGAR